MKTFSDPKIQNFFLSLPEEKREIALALREIILSVSKKTDEKLKWSQWTLVLGKDNLCFVYTYKSVAYVNLGFMQAVKLKDPKKLFEGTGKGMRHIKIYSMKEIPATQIKRWVKESVELFS